MSNKLNQEALWKDENRLPYHRRQFEQAYRSTVALAEFIRDVCPGKNGDEILDVACGAGSNIFHLGQSFLGRHWTGVDLAGEELFPIGRRYLQDSKVDATLLSGDLYRLADLFPEKKFDLVTMVHTLFSLPRYEEAVDQMLAVTRDWLVVSSLFTDYQTDAVIQVTDYSLPPGRQGPFFYNVHSLDRFKAFCVSRGIDQIVVRDFEIDIDLAPPTARGLGTYTKTLADGKRLQFSGPLAMPWKFVACRKGYTQ